MCGLVVMFPFTTALVTDRISECCLSVTFEKGVAWLGMMLRKVGVGEKCSDKLISQHLINS